MCLILTDERVQWLQHLRLPNANPLPSIVAHSVSSNPATGLAGRPLPSNNHWPVSLQDPHHSLLLPNVLTFIPTSFGNQEKRAVGQGQPWPIQRPRRGSLKAGLCSLKTHLTEEELGLFAQVPATSWKYFPTKDLIFGVFETSCSLHFNWFCNIFLIWFNQNSKIREINT